MNNEWRKEMPRPDVRHYVPLDEGVYSAYLIAVDEKPGQNGPFYSWKFGVPQEGGKDRIIYASSPNYVSDRNKTRSYFKALLSRELAENEDAHTDRLLGRSCQLVVKHHEKDGQMFDRVTEILKAPGQKPLPVVLLEDDADEESGDIPF